MKISLVLSGGAARGGFHLGVIEALLEKDFQIEAVSGSSIGALIGMSLSAGVTPQEQINNLPQRGRLFIFKKLDEMFELGYQTALKHPLLQNN